MFRRCTYILFMQDYVGDPDERSQVVINDACEKSPAKRDTVIPSTVSSEFRREYRSDRNQVANLLLNDISSPMIDDRYVTPQNFQSTPKHSFIGLVYFNPKWMFEA